MKTLVLYVHCIYYTMVFPKPNYESFGALVARQPDWSLPPSKWTFKQHPELNHTIESVSKELGGRYVQAIRDRFPQVTFDIIKSFVVKNDQYGSPQKFIYEFPCVTSNTTKLLYGSPSSLRYAMQALLVLEHLSTTPCSWVVELGAGYGGMYVALLTFLPLFTLFTPLTRYVAIELPDVAVMTRTYLQTVVNGQNASGLKIPNDVVQMNLAGDSAPLPYHIWTWDEMATKMEEERSAWMSDAFFVSHLGFTELDGDVQEVVRKRCLRYCSHGMLTWQTCFGDDVQYASEMLGNRVSKVDPEVPDTVPSYLQMPNYYVYF